MGAERQKIWFMTREKTNEVEDEEYPQTDTVYVWK